TGFSFTVTAQDTFNNTATGYTGAVTFSSSDPLANLPGTSSLPGGSGTFSATLKTAGNQTLTATDTTTPSITGTSSPITVLGLVVTSFTQTPSGFTATFNKPFDNTTPTNSTAQINLYDSAAANDGAPDVTLALNGTTTTITGSLIIDPTNTQVTFV